MSSAGEVMQTDGLPYHLNDKLKTGLGTSPNPAGELALVGPAPEGVTAEPLPGLYHQPAEPPPWEGPEPEP